MYCTRCFWYDVDMNSSEGKEQKYKRKKRKQLKCKNSRTISPTPPILFLHIWIPWFKYYIESQSILSNVCFWYSKSKHPLTLLELHVHCRSGYCPTLLLCSIHIYSGEWLRSGHTTDAQTGKCSLVDHGPGLHAALQNACLSAAPKDKVRCS